MKYTWIIILLIINCTLLAQTNRSLLQKRIVYNDYPESVFDSLPIYPQNIQLFKTDGSQYPTSLYTIDSKKATIFFKEIGTDTLQIRYWQLPHFLTKKHTLYNTDRIVADKEGNKLFQITPKNSSTFTPFDGLETKGNISRAITVGNNQNLVTTSNLDLQITGKLSENINLKASIQDNNSPLQNGGYSKKLDEFNQIFMELYSQKWSIKAGDLFAENRSFNFLNFNKKIQGISSRFIFEKQNSKTIIENTAALARGQYAKSEFVGIEGNQGPYKLQGENNELYILIITDSERVFVNGKQLTRGENQDYTIDYNAGEIRFTTLYPITADMRISIEYQYTDRNFTRFLGYSHISHHTEKWKLNGGVYTETDIKNQPLQQSLSQEQITVLQQAGNNPEAMYALSAYIDTYSENKILYKKATHQGVEYFEFSNNPEDVLYMVAFSYMGENAGDYILISTNTIGKIFQYIAPINGIKQGNYAPLIKLVPPTKTTIFASSAQYNSSNNRTQIFSEWALSNKDQNLFSTIDDQNNKGWAAILKAQHQFLSKWQWTIHANARFVHQNFSPIERLNTIEFNRNWGVTSSSNNQSMISVGVSTQPNENSSVNYILERLEYNSSYQGIKHTIAAEIRQKKWNISSHSNVLSANATTQKSNIFKTNNEVKYLWKKNILGTRIDIEHYEAKNKTYNTYEPYSQKYWQTDFFINRGDTAKTNIELGWIIRANDSLYTNKILPSTKSNTTYIKSQLIKNNTSQLSVYANYRIINYLNKNEKDHSLNSKLVYSDKFFKDWIQWHTIYETSAGNIAQQEYTYIKVEPGLGTHTWNDYNNNGIQELEEFEIAPYPDLAIYMRMMLPNQKYVRTHQNKWTQLLNINFSKWQNEKEWKYWISKFYIQTAIISEKNFLKDQQNIVWNPLENNEEKLVAINESIRNSLYFHRGKQHFSTTYSFIKNRTKNALTFGSLENILTTHLLQWSHLIQKIWLVESDFSLNKNESHSENYDSKNFHIHSYSIYPKLSYILSPNARIQLFYEYTNKKNILGIETLNQNKIGMQMLFQSEKSIHINGDFALYNNKFQGNQYSAVAYHFLEGLLPGKNITWRLMIQRNITKYLEANINYQGRTSESSTTIHTGSVQLRAFF